MTDEIAGFDFYPLQATDRGAVLDFTQRDAFLKAVDDPKVTDVLVMSHGWKTNGRNAREELYAPLLTSLRALIKPKAKAAGVIALGVFWPSKPGYDASGAVADGAAVGLEDADSRAALIDALAGLEQLIFDPQDDEAGDRRITKEQQVRRKRLDAARALIERLPGSESAQNEFVRLLRATVTSASTDRTEGDSADTLLAAPGAEVLSLLQQEPEPEHEVAEEEASGEVIDFGVPTMDARGADEGRAASFGFGDIFDAARQAVELLSFFEMKERAGKVGFNAVNHVLSLARERKPTLRLHLVGHSFGARVVCAAVDGAKPVKPSSLTLLQAALSHNGLTEDFNIRGDDGFFHGILKHKKVDGPILITHTKNDTAVGRAYPWAVRIKGDNRLSVGGPDDEYGAMGSNGVVGLRSKQVQSLRMLDVGGAYAFKPGVVANLLSDDFIVVPGGGDAHGRVTGSQVAHAILKAMRL